MKRFMLTIALTLVCLLTVAVSAVPVTENDFLDLAAEKEWSAVRLMNEARIEEGLLPLALSAEVQTAAVTRVGEINAGFIFIRPDDTTPDTLANEIDLDFDRFGQIYAVSFPDTGNVVSKWLSISDYSAHILDPAYTQVGAAYAEEAEAWSVVFTGTCAFDQMEILATAGAETFFCGTSVSELGLYAAVSCGGAGTSYIPVTAGMVEGYDPDQTGRQTITVRYGNLTADVNIILESNGQSPAEPFADVREDDWYYSAVTFVQRQGLFAGTGDNTFDPDVEMSRAMFVTVAGKMAVRLGEEITGDPTGFSDVVATEWYYHSVCWASSIELVKGMGDGTFGTDDSITREQMCVLFVKFARAYHLDLPESSAAPGCTDYSAVSDWAKEAVAISYHAGLVAGYTDNTFRPQETASRAEVAALFQSFVTGYLSD